jgi:hypothetical protein
LKYNHLVQENAGLPNPNNSNNPKKILILIHVNYHCCR